MRISTKTLASLFLVTTVAAALPGVSQIPGKKNRRESQFDRLLHRHDRKGEIRAELLGLDPLVFRDLQKRVPFSEIARQRGFSDARGFRLALLGKLKNELRHRGWTSRKIDRFVLSRQGRIG